MHKPTPKSGNALRFATYAEAEASARDLASRWLLVREWRVSPSDDPPNYRWDPELGLCRLTQTNSL